MKYEDWKKSISEEITEDSIWNLKVKELDSFYLTFVGMMFNL